MTITDWILAITALILLWYAYETRNLRKIMSEQLEIMKKQLAKEFGLLKPFFQYKSGSFYSERAEVRFQNSGGAAMSIKVVPTNNFSISVSNSDYVGTGETLILNITASGLDGGVNLPFKIECLDRAGNFHSFDYVCNGSSGVRYLEETRASGNS